MPKDQVDGRAHHAKLYRMVMDDHVCPYGLKAKALLERKNFVVEDHWLKTREETDVFQREHGVDTTPQIFIGDERIGGYDGLREYLGQHVQKDGETSYRPIIAIFSVGFLMALAVSHAAFGTVFTVRALEWFIAISMCLLGIQKLQDIEGFSTMFLNYDLLGKRVVRYAYFYPFGETLAGILMISGSLIWIAAPVALFIYEHGIIVRCCGVAP